MLPLVFLPPDCRYPARHQGNPQLLGYAVASSIGRPSLAIEHRIPIHHIPDLGPGVVRVDDPEGVPQLVSAHASARDFVVSLEVSLLNSLTIDTTLGKG